jgi:hypothetical protein
MALVRRVLGITLVLLFSFPLISPLLASGSISEASLPACCRRNGAHHCMMGMAQARWTVTSFSAVPQKCPFYPTAVTPVRHGDLGFASAALIFAEMVNHPSVKAQTQAHARIALYLSRHKRGPPAELLS